MIETSLSDTNPIKNNPKSLSQKDVDIDGINYHLSRFMGCFGSGIYGLIQYEKVRYAGFLTNIPQFSGMIYRGCKYGLINPTPLNSSAVYSSKNYGQFRDMLEQRQTSVFSSPSTGIPGDSYPVTVRFIDRSTGAALPVGEYSGTNSINLSPYCTSSFPYFDGEVKDRELPLPEQSIFYVPVFPA